MEVVGSSPPTLGGFHAWAGNNSPGYQHLHKSFINSPNYPGMPHVGASMYIYILWHPRRPAPHPDVNVPCNATPLHTKGHLGSWLKCALDYPAPLLHQLACDGCWSVVCVGPPISPIESDQNHSSFQCKVLVSGHGYWAHGPHDFCSQIARFVASSGESTIERSRPHRLARKQSCLHPA